MHRRRDLLHGCTHDRDRTPGVALVPVATEAAQIAEPAPITIAQASDGAVQVSSAKAWTCAVGPDTTTTSPAPGTVSAVAYVNAPPAGLMATTVIP